jgi:aminopeptidase N
MSKRALLLALALLAIAATPARAAGPSPGAAGLGDRLDLGLGNGGYDALHYDLDVRYATSAPSQPIDGTVTIAARATQALSQFNLDFAGQGVGSVWVDGARARWRRDGEELVITPRRFVRDREFFVVTVSHFTAVPTEPTEEFDSTALFVAEDGSATAGQPFAEHLVYPSNDHPRDKATFTFRLDVPAGTTAVANGVPLGHWTRNGRTTWLYAQRQPMATELTQLAMGDLQITTPGRHPGTLLRDVTPTAITDELRPFLAREPSQMDWMEARVGRYPFDAYGSVVVRADLGFSLETQTLTIHPADLFDTDYWEPTMLHELAHQWFGDSVAPYEWSDIWLNEGHASWYEFLYAEETGQLVADTEGGWPDETGYATVDELMRATYAHGDEWRVEDGPVALTKSEDTMFSRQSYLGGALVLYALRQVVGNATFQRIEREWVDRYRGRSASTADFIALASEVSHRDLSGFLRAWLYGTETPPMPGHPDWTVNSVTEQAPTARTLAPTQQRRRR